MSPISRRLLLGTTALVMGGCAAAIPVVAWAAQAASLASGLAGIASEFSSLTGISASAQTTITSGLGTAQTLANQLAQITDPTTALTTLQKIETALNDVVADAQPYAPSGSDLSLALLAAQLVLPVVEAAINPVATPATSSLRRPMGPPGAKMSTAMAWSVLKGIADKHPLPKGKK